MRTNRATGEDVDGTPDPGEEWLSAAEASRRLGVTPATLYAYVSRGLVTSYRTSGERTSRYSAREVGRLAARSRGAGTARGLEVVVDTELTLLDPAGHLYYRGHDATELCRHSSFETVAELLWTGRLGDVESWSVPEANLAVAREIARLLPVAATPVDRLRTVICALAPADPLRHDRRPEAVASTARILLATMVDCLEPAGAPDGVVGVSVAGVSGGAPTRGLAAALWPALTSEPPNPERLAALNGALVLLADHELAASTLAARVAASTWADPYLVVAAGLAVLGGPLHGGASERVRDLLAAVGEIGAAGALGQALQQGQTLPGFGHKVYTSADPRSSALIGLVSAGWPDRVDIGAARALIDLVASRDGPAPNVDLALGLFTTCAGMVRGAGETIFAVARSAGLVAHAIEEYEHRLRFRPRAAYVGPLPAGVGSPAQL
jgi:citrate synthase